MSAKADSEATRHVHVVMISIAKIKKTMDIQTATICFSLCLEFPHPLHALCSISLQVAKGRFPTVGNLFLRKPYCPDQLQRPFDIPLIVFPRATIVVWFLDVNQEWLTRSYPLLKRPTEPA